MKRREKAALNSQPDSPEESKNAAVKEPAVKSSNSWSAEEDAALLEALKSREYGEWAAISTIIGKPVWQQVASRAKVYLTREDLAESELATLLKKVTTLHYLNLAFYFSRFRKRKKLHRRKRRRSR